MYGSSLGIALLAALLVEPASAPLVEATQDADQVRVHMKVVRDHRLSIEERTAAMDSLLELGTEGPRQLAAQVASDAKGIRRRAEKDRDRLLRDFEKRAARIATEHLARKATNRVEELRDVILRNTRAGGLTKETIVAESDPALASLEEILVVTDEQVFDAEEDLVARSEVLRELLLDETTLFDYWTRARDRLETLPDGDRIARRLRAPFDPANEAEALTGALARAAKLATPMPDSDRRTLEKNHALLGEVDPSEAEGIEILNLLRVRLGLAALKLDPLLCKAGRDHSKDMVELDFFSHTSPVEGKETPGQRAALAGTSGSAENIAMGQSTAAGAIGAWWHSPGHHKNMLGGHARVGLGRHESHWTQMFGK